jgi:chromatin remodeling complex protein RSC6
LLFKDKDLNKMPKSKNDVSKTSEVEVKIIESVVPVKTKSKKVKEETPVPVPVPVPVVVAQPVKEETKKSDDVESTVEEGETDSVKKQRRVVNREEVGNSLDSLVKMVEDEVLVHQEGDSKSKGKVVKFLKTLSKHLRQVKTDFVKVLSRREPKVKSERSVNSGFLKPVKISGEMQKFTGLKEDQLVSRVEVTKAICKYVKDHNLQNQADKRQFTPDEKLAKLLDTKDNLTYYNLQKSIQRHFVK